MISVIAALLAVCLSVRVAVAGQTLVPRLVSSKARIEHNDVAGFIYSV